jgi:zinc transport system ATP-binding protein
MTENSVIRIRNLDFSYTGAAVVSKANFDIIEGEFAAVIGPNGGGKTTLLKLILGLLEPDRGTIQVLGTTPTAARRHIGYMPQYLRLDPDFPVTVTDVVLMGRLGQSPKMGPYRGRDREAVRNALEEVRCLDLRKRPFSSLSSGQRQRVLIARALASEPKMLLLDEPTSNLDPSIQDDFHDVLHELNRRMTVVIVSHDVGFVSKHVKKVICVNRSVVLHPTSEMKGDLVSMLYGEAGVRIVDHGHHTHEE